METKGLKKFKKKEENGKEERKVKQNDNKEKFRKK